MNETVRIRQFEVNDLSEIFNLALDTLKEAYTPTFLIDLHSYWPEGFIVLEERGAIQGFIAGILMSRAHARILMLGVRKTHRRRGYGTMLCMDFLRRCAMRGVRMVTLEVRTGNEAAISMYLKMGFSPGMRLNNYYTDGESALKMQLIL
jgi:ribosomal protein S18 acetylase RimI-like enzyme